MGGHRQERQEAQHRRNHARAAARQRRLTASRSSRPAVTSSTSASRTIGARTSTSISAATISTNCASNISATRPSRIEAFKANTVDWRTENSAKNWATAYDFPAVTDKRVILEEFPIKNFGLMQAFAFNIRRDKFKDPARAASLQLRVRLRGDEQEDFLRPIQAHRQLFRGHGSRRHRPADRPRARTAGNRARQGPARTLYQALHQSGQRQPRTQVRNNLREAMRLLQRGRLRGPRSAARQRQDRRAFHGRVSRQCAGLRARLPVLQAVARTPRHRGFGAHGRRGAIREPAAHLGFRHHHLRLGGIAAAGQRTARLLGLAGGRSARIGQRDRHQKSGGRRDDRQVVSAKTRDRSHRRHQGARPHPAVEPLRRAAMGLRQIAHRALGPLQPSRPVAEIRHVGVPDVWWWDAEKAAKTGGTDGSHTPPRSQAYRRRLAGARRRAPISLPPTI